MLNVFVRHWWLSNNNIIHFEQQFLPRPVSESDIMHRLILQTTSLPAESNVTGSSAWSVRSNKTEHISTRPKRRDFDVAPFGSWPTSNGQRSFDSDFTHDSLQPTFTICTGSCSSNRVDHISIPFVACFEDSLDPAKL